MSYRKIVLLFIAIVATIVAVPISFLLFEEVDAGEVLIVQSPTTGQITVYTEPGPKWQGFGKVTKYRLRDQAWFVTPEEGEKVPVDARGQLAIDIRFNDGGKAMINGSIAYELPLDRLKLVELHRRYGTQEALEQQVIRTVVEKAIYMSGPLMSSTESYASRRNELLGYVEDQVQNGVYKTKSRDVKLRDESTGEEKTVRQVDLVVGQDGKPVREQTSILSDMGIKAYNMSVRRVKYEERIEAQIHKQQESAAQAQQSAIEARTAEQKSLTATAEAAAVKAKLVGEAEAKKAEAIARAEADLAVEALTAMKAKTNAVIMAEQKLEVARLDAKTAEEFKRSEQLRGEGEAARRKAVLDADGALEKKLEAYVDIQKAYATALSKYTGPLVPQIVLGGQQGQTGGQNDAMTQLLQTIAVKSARDLALDLNVTNRSR